jgi:hypothetical protein
MFEGAANLFEWLQSIGDLGATMTLLADARRKIIMTVQTYTDLDPLPGELWDSYSSI